MQIDHERLSLLADRSYMLLVAGIRNLNRTEIFQLGCKIVLI